MSSLAQAPELSMQEQSAVSALNDALSTRNNRLVGMINDRGKADDLQSICLRLDTGTTVKELDAKIVERVLQIPDTNMRKQVSQYFAAVEVIAIRRLCPRHGEQLDASIKNP
jgi:hypothetical protein